MLFNVQLEKEDCFRTCISCLLNIHPNEVPDFCNEKVTNWQKVTQTWLGERGYCMISMDVLKDHISLQSAIDCGAFPDIPYILSGNGPRGKRHCVIGKYGKIIHDPHKSIDGLDETQELNVEYIVRLP